VESFSFFISIVLGEGNVIEDSVHCKKESGKNGEMDLECCMIRGYNESKGEIFIMW